MKDVGYFQKTKTKHPQRPPEATPKLANFLYSFVSNSWVGPSQNSLQLTEVCAFFPRTDLSVLFRRLK